MKARACLLGLGLFLAVGCGSDNKGVCSYGADQTCNEDLTIGTLHGMCRPDGTCICNPGFSKNPATGKCI